MSELLHTPPKALRRLPSGRHGLSREEVRASQRQRLVYAVAETVGARGFSATRIGDITRAAGVAKRCFYEHFIDKENAFLLSYDRFAAELNEGLSEAMATAEGTWLDRVEAGFGAYLGLLDQNPLIAQAMLVEVFASGPAGLTRRRALHERIAEHVEAARHEAGIPSTLDATLRRALVGGTEELIRNALVDGQQGRLVELAPLLRSLVEQIAS